LSALVVVVVVASVVVDRSARSQTFPAEISTFAHRIHEEER